MKIKFFFSALLLFVGIATAKSQYVNNVSIKDLDADYIVIWPDGGPIFSSKVTVRIDYGQGGRIPQIQDNKRKVITFNSMVSAINMMSRSGFELDRIVRDPKGENEYYYFKRRNISSVGNYTIDSNDN